MPPASACDRIALLRGVTWEWRDDAPPGLDGQVLAGEDMGVIAQEVAEVLPALVRLGDDGLLAVDYGGLLLELALAVGELAAREPTMSTPACDLVAQLRTLAPTDGGVPQLDEQAAADLFSSVARRGADGVPRLDPITLVAPLIEAVKELGARLRALESAA